MLKLQFRDRRQESVWLVDENFTIGKNKTNSLVIDSSSISDQHAEIVQQGRRMLIRDLAAENGVFVNGVRVIGEQQLSPGNIIKLGDVELEIVDPQNVASFAPADEAEWKLLATASWMNGQIFEIKGSMVLGRDSGCDIAIPVEHLSRRHAELSIQGGKLIVKDLESANGTYVNGQKVDETTLKPGDKLKFDVITFTIQGPEHDPNKTVIRQAIKIDKSALPELKRPAKAPASAADPKAQTKPAPRPAPKPAPKSAPKSAPKPESRVAGKSKPSKEDSWITEPTLLENTKTPKTIIAAIVVIAMAAGFAAILLML